MAKSPANTEVGDKKTPPSRASESALRKDVDRARSIEIESTSPVSKNSAVKNLGRAMQSSSQQNGTVGGCKRTFWLSFFFDGTGNNMEADIGMLKHSCIARLFLVHKPVNVVEGVFPIYIPGLGTYFPEVGDEGGTLGKAFAKGGDKRLDYALTEFDKLLAVPLKNASNPRNEIKEINLAIFGFSRGAALARAFTNKFMEERCDLRNGEWRLKIGGWKVRFRFMGIFDTVASVGNPMSRNNTDFYNPAFSDVRAVIDERIDDYPLTCPEALAFSLKAMPGADPAPGRHAGHDSWGEKLKIHESVEEVWHFIGAHEIRNSFPLDSISVLTKYGLRKPSNFHEVLYLGSHSDVGGGYAPGEGGKSLLPSENLCLIPLRHMYDRAVHAGVPMAVEWSERNKEDFKTDAKLIEVYNHYLKTIGRLNNLGDAVIKHMQYFFAWRFRMMRQQGRLKSPEAAAIAQNKEKFGQLQKSYGNELAKTSGKEALANVTRNALLEVEAMKQEQRGKGGVDNATANRDALAKAEKDLQQARAARLRDQAKYDAVPNMSSYQAMLDLYDNQLLSDVEAIRNAIAGKSRDGKTKDSAKRNRNELRPHYAALLEAWENEYLRKNGLKDELIISFFDKYLHDSLAGFATDATLPSDPRVIYVGEDVKLKYASEGNGNLSDIAAIA